MASSVESSKRHFLLCPMCKRTHFSLPVHLRRVCMCNASEEEIAAVVAAAKVEAAELLRSGRVWDYGFLRALLEDPDPVSRTNRMIQELEARGNTVLNIPSAVVAPAEPVPSSEEESYQGPPKKWRKSMMGTQKKGFSQKHSLDPLGSLTPRQCLAVLHAAKQDFLRAIGKLTGPEVILGDELSKPERQLIQYYLQAVLVLKHQQRPTVVENLTVNEWVKRTRDASHPGYVVIRGPKCKTAATQVALFALSQEEEMWFNAYYTEVRPAMFGRNPCEPEAGGNEKFFISSSGNPIYNCSNDLRHLHENYSLPNITSLAARRAFETATRHLSHMDRSVVADYLSPSTSTELGNVIRARMLLSLTAGESDSGSGEPVPHTSAARCPQMDERAAYDLFIKSFPVAIDGKCPGKSVRTELVGVTYERLCYDHWRTDQKTLRMKHAIEHFGRRLPTEHRVHAWMEKEGWTSNCPDVHHILKQWRPSGSVDTALDCSMIKKLIHNQRWMGLISIEIEGKGRGVKATRKFVTGEVVCDYHGRQITRQEGLQIHSQMAEGQSGYMFFYKDRNGQAKCIDANDEHCQCHPDMHTFGRLINHSSKRANLRPRLHRFDDKDILLFFAMKDIAVDEELMYDYGVRRRSFAGEGLDLDWL